MKDEELTKLAREMLEVDPMDLRLSILWAVGERLKDHAREMSIPPEEVVTEELMEEAALMVVEHVLGVFHARFEEFVTREEQDRIFHEEFERLAQEEPVGRVREDELLEAVTERVRRKYPHVLENPWRRRGSSG
jgi:hypothetical protein